MNTNTLIAILAVGAVGSGAAFFLFGGDDEEVTQNEPAAESDMVTEVSLPADFPGNIPMYPGAVLTNVQESTDDTARNITMTLETPDSVADVNTWYRGALSESGWAVTSDKNVGGYILLKGENENVAVFTQVAGRSDLGVSVITERVQIK